MNSWMKCVSVFVCVSSVVLQGVAASGNETATTKPTTAFPSSTTNATLTVTELTTSNDTLSQNQMPQPKDTNGMLQRSLYVAVGISTLVALYFIVRTIKTRGRRKAKKYGVIHGTGEMELQPLDKHVDEDEEDMTLFDVKDAKRLK